MKEKVYTGKPVSIETINKQNHSVYTWCQWVNFNIHVIFDEFRSD